MFAEIVRCPSAMSSPTDQTQSPVASTSNFPTVCATAVSGDDGNLLMQLKPSGCRRRFAVRQERHRLVSLEVADNRSVALIAPPRPVINADDVQPIARRPRSSAYNAKQGIVAHRRHKPSGKARGGPPAERQTEMVDDAIKAMSSAGLMVPICQRRISPRRSAAHTARHHSETGAPRLQGGRSVPIEEDH